VLAPATLAVTQSTHHAGARPVAVTLQMRYEMQCSWPGPGTLEIRFPAGVKLPSSIAAGAVFVNGRPATASRPSAGVVDVALPARPQVLCDLIGPGRVTVAFTKAARVGIPKKAGSYTVRARHRADRAAGRLTVA
jgi:hypothetical protein